MGIDNVSFIPTTPFHRAACGIGELMTRNRSLPFGKAVLVGLGLISVSVIPFGSAPMGPPMSLAPRSSNGLPGGVPWGEPGFTVAAHAQPRDPVVTSDSPEYCGVLMDRISGMTRTAAARPPIEAAVLSEEGERMCVNGQTRGGILRLRRALEIMRHGDD
jgi:hypothetical protein